MSIEEMEVGKIALGYDQNMNIVGIHMEAPWNRQWRWLGEGQRLSGLLSLSDIKNPKVDRYVEMNPTPDLSTFYYCYGKSKSEVRAIVKSC